MRLTDFWGEGQAVIENINQDLSTLLPVYCNYYNVG